MILRALSMALAGASALVIAASVSAAPLDPPKPPAALGLPKPALAKPRPAATAAREAGQAQGRDARHPGRGAVPDLRQHHRSGDGRDPRPRWSAPARRAVSLDKRDAAAVAEYYAEQGFTPSWTANGKLTPQALSIVAAIRKASEEGLDPKNYNLPVVQLGVAQPATAEAVAEADVLLSDAIVTYARHLHSGMLDPAAVSENFDYAPHLLDPLAVLATMTTERRSGGDVCLVRSEAQGIRRAEAAAGRDSRPAARHADSRAGRRDP